MVRRGHKTKRVFEKESPKVVSLSLMVNIKMALEVKKEED